jgi:hypothetical protein
MSSSASSDFFNLLTNSDSKSEKENRRLLYNMALSISMQFFDKNHELFLEKIMLFLLKKIGRFF